jgi:hypothetical protein
MYSKWLEKELCPITAAGTCPHWSVTGTHSCAQELTPGYSTELHLRPHAGYNGRSESQGCLMRFPLELLVLEHGGMQGSKE